MLTKEFNFNFKEMEQASTQSWIFTELECFICVIVLVPQLGILENQNLT